MSKSALFLGLILSAALHVWLLMLPSSSNAAAPAPTPPPKQMIPIPVVAAPPTPEPPAPAPSVEEPQPQPLPESAPEPEQPMEIAAAAPEQPAPPPTPTPAPEPMPEPEPTPTLVEATPPVKNDATARGDLAGTPKGREAPVIRIDWGTESDALRVLDAGGMRIVVLEGPDHALRVTGALERQPQGWINGAPVPAGRFSSRLRIVDEVPAFGGVRREAGVQRPQRLAVLVPPAIEHKLESAQLEAVFRAGLTLEQIRHVAGRFTLEEGVLGFQVVSLGQR